MSGLKCPPLIWCTFAIISFVILMLILSVISLNFRASTFDEIVESVIIDNTDKLMNASSTSSSESSFVPSTLFKRTKNPPNILFILSDDYGWHDIGYNNDEIKDITPNLDYLANHKHGIKLTNYYTLCICSASRGVILTGRYDIFNGLQGIATQSSKRGVSLKIKLISDYLVSSNFKTYNYSTYFLGKWHIGKYDWKQTPTHRGFKYFYGMLGGASNYFTHMTGQNKYDWHEHIGLNCDNKHCARLVIEDYNKYSTTLLSSKTIEIIKNHSNMDNIHNNPFFIFLSYQAIHSPPQVPIEYVLKFKDKINNDKRRFASGMINCMDEGIGNITKILKYYNLLNNTIIIFTSDNGAAIDTGDGVGGENWPLRGAKHSIYEGGTKVPAFIYYHRFSNNDDYHKLFHSSDWTPTLIDAISDDNYNYNLSSYGFNGKSHWNNLLLKSGNERKDILKYVYYGYDNPIKATGPGKKFGLRYDNYKLLFDGGGSPNLWYKYDENNNQSKGGKARIFDHRINVDASYKELYDIENDPFETHNIYSDTSNNTKLYNMIGLLLKWRNTLKQSSIPIFNANSKKSVQSLFNFTMINSSNVH